MSAPQWLVDQVESLDLSPLDAMIAAEEADAEARRLAALRREALSPNDCHPTNLLMGSQSWPVPDDKDGYCGTCHGLPKSSTTYCLCCDTPKGTLAGLAQYQAQAKAAKERGGKKAKGQKETRKERRARKGKKAA